MAKKAARTASTPGRKPLPEHERRTVKVHVRFRPDENAEILAVLSNEDDRAAFIREAALKEARRLASR